MKFIGVVFLLLPTWIWAQNYFNLEEDPPTLELGVALVNATTPHYPGSDQQTSITLPFPAIIYRGDKLRADEDGGFRGRFLHSDNFELNLSLGGALPVGSDDNDERSGMPKLDTILEFGPGLIIHFVPKASRKKYRISLSLPIRFAISTDISDTYGRGVLFNPLLYGFYKIDEKFAAVMSVSGTWATQKLHNYLYTVDPKFSTPTRSAYQAESGYLLTTMTLGLNYLWKEYSVFAGYALHNASDNANRNSPLFVQKTNHSIGLGFIWWFYESKT